MEIRKILIGISCLFVVFLNASCHSPSRPKYLMALHLTPGSKYDYAIVSNVHSTVELDKNKVESGRKVDLALTYEVLRNSADTIAIKVTYDKLHLIIRNNDLDKDIVAKASSETSDPIEKFFGSLLGSSITVYLNHKGDVLRVEGYDSISNKILASITLRENNARNNIRQQMNKMVGEDFVKNTFQQTFKIFPDTAIYIDDSWSRQGTQSEEVNIGMNTIFTLNAIKNNTALVDIRSVLNGNKDGDSLNVLGYQALANLEGGQKGHFDVDTTTGMLMNGESTLSLEGKIQIMGREIPVKIISEKKMEGKRIH